VKPGGRLVYVTCSVLPEENEDAVAAFLAGGAPFQAIDIASVGAGAQGLRLQDHARRAGPGLQMSPRLTGTDGFFVCVLQRA
jgi:16S rRNA (cytosine967-C5)-methyltransferase